MFENRIFKILLFFLVTLAPVSMYSQVPVTVSKQKIVVEGKVYYMHQVQKGQTLYSISKAYNVPIDVIKAWNDIPDTGIKEDQMLKIPDLSSFTEKEKEAKIKDETKRPVQTVPQPQPHPQSQSQSQTQTRTDKEVYHRVERGETLGSIAERYNISVRELKKANKGLLFPAEGDYLLIPSPGAMDPRVTTSPFRQIQQEAAMPGSDTLSPKPDSLVTEPQEEIVFSNDRTYLRHLNGTVRVAVLLPFFLRENAMRSYTDSTRTDSKGHRIYKEIYLPGSWIYEGSVPFLEMYEGILIAADSLRSMGLNVELDVYDVDFDTTRVESLIASGSLDDADLIIGPVFSNNLGKVAGYAAGKDIPVVSPVPLRDQTILDDRPTLFRICPSLSVSQDIIVEELSRHHGSNIIFLYSDSLMIDPQTELFWRKITERTAAQQDGDSTVITPLYFSGIVPKNAVAKGIVTLESLMDSKRENIIVLNTTETPKVSAAFSILHTLSKRYVIKAMGYPEIGSLPTIDLKYYYNMELLIPSENFVDFDKTATRNFVKSFFRKFNTEPAQESFAWRGFDIAFYFIGGLAAEGKSFVKRPWKFNPQLVTHDLRFSRDNNRDGFENIGMYILQYNRDMTISVMAPSLPTELRP